MPEAFIFRKRAVENKVEKKEGKGFEKDQCVITDLLINVGFRRKLIMFEKYGI